MTWNPEDQEPRPHAGLFGKRFGRQASTSEWFDTATNTPGWFESAADTSAWFQADFSAEEADMRVVDSDAQMPFPTARAAFSVSDDALDDRTVPLLPPGIPQRHAQVLWEILLPLHGPRSLPQELACTQQSLAAALYPPAPAPPGWLRRWMSSPARKPQQQEVLALELTGTQERLQFFLRGPVPGIARIFDHLRANHDEQLGRAIADAEQDPGADPLIVQPGEAISFAELHLEHPAILPMKTTETLAETAGSDPLSGLLSACAHTADLSRSVRVVSQLLITQAPPGWKKHHQALLERQRTQRAVVARPKLTNERGQEGLALLLLLGIGYLFLAIHGLLLLLFALFLPLLLISSTLLLWWIWRRWHWARLLLRHESAITYKLSQEVAQVCLRLYVIGPTGAPQVCEAALDRLIGAYGAFASLNRWKVGKRGRLEGGMLAHPMLRRLTAIQSHRARALEKSAALYLSFFDIESAFRPQSWWQRLQSCFSGDRVRPVLGINEVAALWHLPALEDRPDSWLARANDLSGTESKKGRIV